LLNRSFTINAFARVAPNVLSGSAISVLLSHGTRFVERSAKFGPSNKFTSHFGFCGPTFGQMTGARDAKLQQAIVDRDRLMRRMTFWEHWRGRLMLPLIVLGGLAGLSLGYVIESALRWPDRTRFVGAVVGILAVGRWVSSYFDARQLEVAARRVQQRQRRMPDEPTDPR
jgi:hypothetical protein